MTNPSPSSAPPGLDALRHEAAEGFRQQLQKVASGAVPPRSIDAQSAIGLLEALETMRALGRAEGVAERENKAWLLEHREDRFLPPYWWAGGGKWTTDANEAIRYMRAQDADAARADVPRDDSRRSRLYTTEHVWLTR